MEQLTNQNTQIQENKIKYLELLSKANIDLTKLAPFLENVGYFNAPFTAKSFKAYDGGLCEYALAMYNSMIKLRESLNLIDIISEESIIKVALFKNFYKCALLEKTIKNQLNKQTGTWETVSGYGTSDDRPMYGSVGISSYALASHFVTFSDSERLALWYGALGETNVPDIYGILTQNPLVTLTHMADLAVCYL